VEVTRERVDRDVDDGRVEDRHDGAEHDDGRDEQQAAIELAVVARGSGGRDGGSGRGHGPAA
jgi:hypothetical protein